MQNTDHPSAWEHEQLAAWLKVYELDRQLRDSSDHHANMSPASPESVSVAPGQIRVLPPVRPTLPENERPVFVLILACHNDHSVIVPFGRFDIPATPGEWATEAEHMATKVLCFWNIRHVSIETLEKSWLANTLSGQQVQTIDKARTAFKSHQQRATRRHGPPLVHALDPRHIYLHEEQTLLDDWIAAINAPEKQGATLFYPVAETDVEYKRAAEDSEPYGADNDT